MWKLVFRGQLERDVSREQAVAGLAKLLRKSPGEVESRLFSGRPVRIATVATEDEAQQYKRAFARAGAFLEIHEEREPESSAGGAAGSLWRRLNRRVLAMVAAALVLLTALVAGGWYLRPVWQAGGAGGEAGSVAANALATGDLVLLGHLDVNRAAVLRDRLFSDAPVAALVGDDERFWQDLAQAGLDLRRDVDDIYAAYYASAEEEAPSWVVLGDFEPEAIIAWLKKRFDVDRIEGDRVYFTAFDEQRCAAGPMNVAYLFPEGMLVAPVARAGELVNRWRGRAAAERDLSGWRRRQRRQLASLAVFAPSQARRALPGASGLLLSAFSGRNGQPDALYLGAEPGLLPPGMNVSVAVESSDPESLDGMFTKTRDALDKARKNTSKSWPELVPLYERIEVRREDGAMAVDLRLDTDFGKELEALATSFLSQAFGGTVASSSGAEQRLDEHPYPFGDASEDSLKPWQGDYSALTAQWRGGPFAAAVSRLAHVPEEGLVLDVHAEGTNLVNLGRQSELVFLHIDDIADADGNSLLARPDCGPDSNREKTLLDGTVQTLFRDGEEVRVLTASGTKTLQLAPGVEARQVASITGAISYRLPVKVGQRRLDGVVGGLVEEKGMRLYVQAKGSSVGYQLSGNTGVLLAIRALNRDGQYLAWQGEVSSDNLFGPGESGNIRFAGDVRQVEVVWIEQARELRYPLLLQSALPPLPGTSPEPAPAPVIGHWRTLEKAMDLDPPEVAFAGGEPPMMVKAPPALLTSRSPALANGFGINALLDVYVPADLPVAWNLSGGVLEVDRVVRADGTERPWSARVPLYFTPDGGYWMNGAYRNDPERPWLKASATLSDPEAPHESVVGIAGRLLFRAPVAVEQHYLDLAPGTVLETNGLRARVAEWRQGGLYLELSGNPARLVAVNVLDGSGEELGGHVRFSTAGEHPRLWVRLSRQAAKLELVLADDVETQERRFRLVPVADTVDAEETEATDRSAGDAPDATGEEGTLISVPGEK